MNFKEDGLESKFRTDTVVSDRDSGRVVNRERGSVLWAECFVQQPDYG